MNTYLLSTYYVLGPVLSAEDTVVSKRQSSCLPGGTMMDGSWEEKDNKKVDRYSVYQGMIKAMKENKTR